MVRFTQLILLLVVGSSSAFTPPAPTSRAFVRSPIPLRLSEETATTATPPAAPVTSEPDGAGKLVPIKEETVEFTAGILGGAIGFAVGGPVLGAIGAAVANYASKTEQEVGTVIQTVSRSSIEIFNYVTKLDAKYEILTKAQASLQSALDKLKAESGDNKEQIAKVEKALDATTSKIKEINDEYDLVGTGMTALGVVGDLVEKAIKKAGELNDEYKLSDKAKDAVSKAVDSAKTASAEASK